MRRRSFHSQLEDGSTGVDLPALLEVSLPPQPGFLDCCQLAGLHLLLKDPASTLMISPPPHLEQPLESPVLRYLVVVHSSHSYTPPLILQVLLSVAHALRYPHSLGTVLTLFSLSIFHTTVQVLLSVAHALRYLHSLGIVHGDIKLDNVLLKGDGSAPMGFIPKVSQVVNVRSLCHKNCVCVCGLCVVGGGGYSG